MPYRELWLATIFVGAGLFGAIPDLPAAEPVNAPSKVTPIEGTTLSQVTLTPQAAERLGIEITQVRDMQMVRKRWVSGIVQESPDDTATVEAPEQFTTAAGPSSPATVRRWQIQVDPIGELDRQAGSRPARVVPISGTLSGGGWLAEPSAMSPLGTVEDAARPLFYNLPAETPGLAGPGRVLVELALSDGGAARKVVPYASLLYDIEGGTWIYTSPEPLVFVRHPVQVDYIDNEWAVLNDGPPAGTDVVLIGVAELYGTEFKIGK